MCSPLGGPTKGTRLGRTAHIADAKLPAGCILSGNAGRLQLGPPTKPKNCWCCSKRTRGFRVVCGFWGWSPKDGYRCRVVTSWNTRDSGLVIGLSWKEDDHALGSAQMAAANNCPTGRVQGTEFSAHKGPLQTAQRTEVRAVLAALLGFQGLWKLCTDSKYVADTLNKTKEVALRAGAPHLGLWRPSWG